MVDWHPFEYYTAHSFENGKHVFTETMRLEPLDQKPNGMDSMSGMSSSSSDEKEPLLFKFGRSSAGNPVVTVVTPEPKIDKKAASKTKETTEGPDAAASADARRAASTARKVAKERVETHSLIGCMWWALGSRRRARQSWERALQLGTRAGARPELARAYYEIGRRIGSAELRGGSGTEYLQRARTLFGALDLTVFGHDGEFFQERLLLGSRLDLARIHRLGHAWSDAGDEDRQQTMQGRNHQQSSGCSAHRIPHPAKGVGCSQRPARRFPASSM